MSRSTSIIAAAIFISGTLGTAAHAVDSECPAIVEELRTEARGVTMVERGQLMAMLDQAAAALASGGSAQAVERLSGFRSRLKALQNDDKLDPDQGEPLITTAGDAIVCIQMGD